MKIRPSDPENNKTIIFGNSNSGHYYWIGLLSNGHEYFTGQSFRSPATGKLISIRILPEMILGDTNARISIFSFDKEHHRCLKKLVETGVNVKTSDSRSWISFSDLDLDVEKDKNYCFKLDCNDGRMMAVAECGWNKTAGCPDGEQWIGHSDNKNGRFYQGFGLTFLAEISNN